MKRLIVKNKIEDFEIACINAKFSYNFYIFYLLSKKKARILVLFRFPISRVPHVEFYSCYLCDIYIYKFLYANNFVSNICSMITL